MRTWRTMAGIGMALVALVVVPEAVAADGEAVPRLFFQTAEGITAFDLQRGQAAYSAPSARPSGDWSVLVSPTLSRGTPHVRVVNALDGSIVREFAVDEPLHPRVVSFRGDLVALSPHAPGSDGRQPGRARTSLVVASTDGGSTRTYDLPGNVEPEAFSSDGRALFVIDYLPPLAPDRYQVRRLDLATGAVGPVVSPDGATQGQMPGVARTQVMAPDGSRLYTLYTSQTATGAAYAFVHVLDLDEQWAHCVDLPRPFGEAPGAMGITIAPDGEDVYVADVAAGRIAAVPTGPLTVERVGRLSVRDHHRTPYLAADGSLVHVAAGRTLLSVHRGSLVLRNHAAVPSAVHGLVRPADAPLLYVARRHAVDALDPATGVVTTTVTVELPHLAGVGSATPPVGGDTVKCAC